MNYTRERDQFISQATREGIDLDTARKLLRHATTLQRLATAQCNGDWPYNGDRDRPSVSHVNVSQGLTSQDLRARWDKRYTVCPKCETSGVAKSAMRTSDVEWDKPEDWAPSQTRHRRAKVCPDCRTQELVRELLERASIDYWKSHDLATHEMDRSPRADFPFKPAFGGDPRGAVLRLSTPGFPYDDNGRNGGYGLYVPPRER